MKQATNLGELFAKLNDLKSIFHYGQKMIPIIQNLIDFMRETVPLLESINTSIAESTIKIPKATDQITNVTSANELATTEILDKVDAISNDIANSESIIRQVIEAEERAAEDFVKLELLCKDIPEALTIITKMKDDRTDIESLNKIISYFEKITTDAYSITLSLQVQDITAQQLAAVNHLIESVQEKLSGLLSEFSQANIKEPKVESIAVEPGNNGSFNGDARYEHAGEKQQIVDELIQEAKKQPTSQEEIDKLFS